MNRIRLVKTLVIANLFLCGSAFSAPPSGPVIENQRFLPTDLEHLDRFGRGVAVDGNTAIITAMSGNTVDINTGVAYVYQRASAAAPWVQTVKLQAADARRGQYFGTDIDIDGNIAVIGAANDNTYGSESGAAYVFQRDSGGVWSQIAKLLPNDGLIASHFGSSVAVSGNRIIIGANNQSGAALRSGAAYVFTPDSLGTWSQMAKLTGSSSAWPGAAFGYDVDIEGDQAVVGASNQGMPPNTPGAAYAFRLTNGSWLETGVLQSNDPAQLEQFGISVSIETNTIAVGASRELNGQNRVGAVHLFEKNGSDQWNAIQRIDSPLNRDIGNFGQSIAMSSGKLLVGAENHLLAPSTGGAAYVYVKGASQWGLAQSLVGTASVNGLFGNSVALDGNSAFVGASFVDFETGVGYYYDLSAVPEPSTVLLAVTSLLYCIVLRRKGR